MVDHSRMENPLESAARFFSNQPKQLSNLGLVGELTGWKVARLISPLEGKFKGLAFGEYSMSAVANCNYNHEHLAPTVGCECGFHAMFSRNQASDLLIGRRAGLVLLKVELFGNAVVHKLGFRSEEQDVVEIHLPPICSKFWCKKRSWGVKMIGSRWVTVCKSHAIEGTVSVNEMHASLGVDVLVQSDK